MEEPLLTKEKLYTKNNEFPSAYSICKRWYPHLIEDNNDNDIWKFITFTTDPKTTEDWDDRYWEEKIRTLLCSKNKIKCIKFFAGIEHHKNGRKHCHVLALFNKNDLTKNGLNTYMFKRYWKCGNVDVRKVDLKRNKDSIRDCITYIGKEDYYTFNYEWDMMTI